MRYIVSILEDSPEKGDHGLTPWRTVYENIGVKETAIKKAEKLFQKTRQRVRITNDGNKYYYTMDVIK